MIEPYVLPASPYEAFSSEEQNDVPLLIGSNAEEARSLVDVAHVKAATFESDLERSFCQVPAPLIPAYPHVTDADARQPRLDLERDFRFGWDMGPGKDYKPELGRTVSTITRLGKSHRSRWGQCMRVGTRAISPSSGMSSIIWIKSPGTGARQIEKWLRKYPATGLTLLGLAIRTARALLGGRCSPTAIAKSYTSAIRWLLVGWRI